LTTPDSQRGLAAATDRAVVAALESVFADTAVAISSRGPACWASGRCCNFEAAGHRLYVTGLEAAYTVVRAGGSAVTPEAPGAGAAGEAGREALGEEGGQAGGAPIAQSRDRWHGGRVLSLTQVSAARARGGCPFQEANLCGVHTIKPVACRVYFCDKSAQAWQHDLGERMHERVRALHDRFGVPYLYAEWRGLLDMLCAT